MDSSLRVSIPYGKGKVDAFVEVKNRGLGYQFPMGKVKVKNTIREYVTQQYQFPMGKVKKKQAKIVKNSLVRINSLWER